MAGSIACRGNARMNIAEIISFDASMSGKLAWLWSTAEKDRALVAWIRAGIYFRV